MSINSMIRTVYQISMCLGILLFTVRCTKKDAGNNNIVTIPSNYYFPPLTGNTWETIDATSIGWNANQLQAAFDYAGTKNTFGMLVLFKGRIVKEQYWNNWTTTTKYPYNSSGKTIVATLIGMAEQDGLLNINNRTNQYLGVGFSSAPLVKENLITVRHQLAMTSGFDDAVPDDNCTTPNCLIYKADAGTRWAYHNAPYRLLQDIIERVSNKTLNQYFQEKIGSKIGIASNSFWFNYIFYGTTREAARFGILIDNEGVWDNQRLLNANYFNAMVGTSQAINSSYGYLWWLNGKSSFMLPEVRNVFSGSMVPSAPADMLMALGKDDKKIYIVPSKDIIVIRLGDSAGNSFAGPSSFDSELWDKLKLAIPY